MRPNRRKDFVGAEIVAGGEGICAIQPSLLPLRSHKEWITLLVRTSTCATSVRMADENATSQAGSSLPWAAISQPLDQEHSRVSVMQERFALGRNSITQNDTAS